MLWAAGQKRGAREARERLSELYVAGRDAYLSGLVASGQAKAHGDHVPGYARADGARPAGRGLSQLVSDFPGAIAGKPEFRN